jgi:hypothetical protein
MGVILQAAYRRQATLQFLSPRLQTAEAIRVGMTALRCIWRLIVGCSPTFNYRRAT